MKWAVLVEGEVTCLCPDPIARHLHILMMPLTSKRKLTFGHPPAAFFPRLELLEDRTLPTAVVLDPSFGAGGLVLSGPDEEASKRFEAVALQPDGKIVAAGSRYPGTDARADILVARFDSGGQLDPSFGDKGLVTAGFGGEDLIHAVAVQTDGKIVIAGEGRDSDVLVGRYNPDGSPDSGFGTNGFVLMNLDRDDRANALGIQPDGKILVAGIAGEFSSVWDPVNFGELALIRLNQDGSLDPLFGDGGKALSTHGSEGKDLAIQPDGKIVVSGTLAFLNGNFSESTVPVTLRFNADGSLDPDFAVEDSLPSVRSFNEGTAVVLQADGKILVGVEAPPDRPSLDPKATYHVFVRRLNSDGSPDKSFNILLFPEVRLLDLAVLDDGRILAVTDNKVKLITPGGFLSASTVVPVPWIRGAAVRPDGRIVLAGFNANTPFSYGYSSADRPLFALAGLQAVRNNGIFVTGADASGGPDVKVFDAATGQLRFSFFAYDPRFFGGVRVGVGDVNGDGYPDVVTAPGPGGGSDIRVFDGSTGALLRQFFAFDLGFLAGAFVAVGDLDGDGFGDVVVGADAGGGPAVRTFSGRDYSQLHNFFAYGVDFHGGVRVAAGDVNGDGVADIMTGAGPGGGPQVTVIPGSTFRFPPLQNALARFFAFDPAFTGGVYVSAGDVNGDHHEDVVVAAGAGGGPNVSVVSGDDLVTSLTSFFPYDTRFTGGVRIGSVDRDGDGVTEVVCVPGPGGGPDVRTVNGRTGRQVDDFFAYGLGFFGGLFVAG